MLIQPFEITETILSLQASAGRWQVRCDLWAAIYWPLPSSATHKKSSVGTVCIWRGKSSHLREVGEFCCIKVKPPWRWKWKWVAQLCPTHCNSMNYTVCGILQARMLEWPFPSPGDLPNLGIKPRSPALEADSSSAEPIPSQRIFLTQELNWGLLHWRRSLYQLSYQGSLPWR